MAVNQTDEPMVQGFLELSIHTSSNAKETTMQAIASRSNAAYCSTPSTAGVSGNTVATTAQGRAQRPPYLNRKPVFPEFVDQRVFRDFSEHGKAPENASDLRQIGLWCIKNREDDGLRVLLQNGAANSLNLEYGGLNGDDAAFLAHVLRGNATLRELSLKGNHLASEGADAIAGLLEKNPGLSSLDLGGNFIESDGIDSLARVLGSHASLTVLNLQDNSIAEDGGKMIADMLIVNTTLKTVNLAANQLGPIPANAVFDALKSNASVEQLDLTDNELDQSNAEAIGDLLQKNTTLNTLKLSANNIVGSDKDTRRTAEESIADGLERNAVLTTLDLRSFTFYGYLKGAAAGLFGSKIQDLLQRNRTLAKSSDKDTQPAAGPHNALASQFD